MKLRRLYGIVFNLVLAALVISGAAFYTVHRKNSQEQKKSSGIFEIADQVSGKVYGTWPVEEAEEFAIEFIHSVHQSPVRESYRIKDSMLQPVAVRFFSFGAGIQSDLEEDQVLSRDGDALVITGFKTSFKELNYIVGTVSDHLLFINGVPISLKELCGKNAQITMRIR